MKASSNSNVFIEIDISINLKTSKRGLKARVWRMMKDVAIIIVGEVIWEAFLYLYSLPAFFNELL